MTEEAMKITPKARRIVLIVFCIISWKLIWDFLFHYVNLGMNFSYKILSSKFENLAHLPYEQQIDLIRILGEEFYRPHALLLIIPIFLVPLFVGFYTGRHSEKNRYRNIAIIVVLFFFSGLVLDLLHNPHNWKGFLFTMFFLGYLKIPFLLAITSIGAWIGSYFFSNEKGLHLLMYRDIHEKRKRSWVYVGVFIFAFVLKIESINKSVEDFLVPLFRYTYAPIKFNNHSKDRPLLQLSNSTIEKGTPNWRDSIKVQSGDELSLLIYYNNNSYLYKAINTKLVLDFIDKNHFTAALWADNAQPVRQSVAVTHYCKNFPMLTYLKSAWYPNQYEYNWSMPLPFEQSGHEILTRTGLNIGDIDGMWVGQGFFIISLSFQCTN